MRTFACITMLALALAGSTALAGDHPAKESSAKHATAAVRHPLNNVVALDADGTRHALCCCGHEFTVNDKSPTMDHDGISFLMCGEACKEAAMKASDKEAKAIMVDWRAKYDATALVDNTTMKNGKRVATCLCGKTVEVNKKTESISENGVTLYVCGEACATALHGLSVAERLKQEKAVADKALAGTAKAKS